MTNKTEALRLAESISRMDTFTEHQRSEIQKAADLLRRQDELLRQALEAIERLENITPKTGYTALVMRDATKKCRAALAQQDAQARPVTWADAERIADTPSVDEAIRALLDDQTGDNATALVQAVLNAAPTPPVQQEQPAMVNPAYQDMVDAEVAGAEARRQLEQQKHS